MAVVALLAATLGCAAYLLGLWPGLENASVNLRFSMVHSKRPPEIVLVGVDERTLNAPGMRWPLARRWDARAVEVLREDHARTIAYDVQFTQETNEAEDQAFYQAISRAGNVVLAATEIEPGGETQVFGGNRNVADAHARVGAANFVANSSGVLQRYPYSLGGLRSFAVTAAERAGGHPVRASDFEGGWAWIDFPGPVGTIRTVSFLELVQGRVPRSELAGKIVVIGATSPVLQDIHATSVTSSNPMAGPEVQADAIWTALHGNPLRSVPGWVALLSILLAALITPVCCLKLRATRAFTVGLVAMAAYALAAQAAFDAHLIMVVTYPLATAALAALGALIVSYGVERWEHELAERYGQTLETAVRDRTVELERSAAELERSAEELSESQLEAIHRLARAAELKDEDTGMHIERIGRICELLALRTGMSSEDAERLRIASALHDVGKIGVPDRVLLKPAKLDELEWVVMRAHTTTGADILSGSRTALFQLAETIARTHHERWDGSGYPNGLKGTEIPLVGRICAICDVFDALSSRRPYKEPWPFEEVLDEIRRCSGNHLDPELVEHFLALEAELRVAHAQAATETASAELATPAMNACPIEAEQAPAVEVAQLPAAEIEARRGLPQGGRPPSGTREGAARRG